MLKWSSPKRFKHSTDNLTPDKPPKSDAGLTRRNTVARMTTNDTSTTQDRHGRMSDKARKASSTSELHQVDFDATKRHYSDTQSRHSSRDGRSLEEQVSGQKQKKKRTSSSCRSLPNSPHEEKTSSGLISKFKSMFKKRSTSARDRKRGS